MPAVTHDYEFVQPVDREGVFVQKKKPTALCCGSLVGEEAALPIPPILFVSPSLSRCCHRGDSSIRGCYPVHGHRGDASGRGSTDALQLPPGSPPHAPCSPPVGAVTEPAQLPATAGALLPHPFSPYLCRLPGHRRECLLLSSCVTRPLGRVPLLAFSQGNL
jgi:hypothetical protein